MTLSLKLCVSFVLSCLLVSCAPRPYQVCSALRCTKALTHDETVSAQEVKKAWGADAPLHVEVAP